MYYTESVHINRLPDLSGGDPAVEFMKVVMLMPMEHFSRPNPMFCDGPGEPESIEGERPVRGMLPVFLGQSVMLWKPFGMPGNPQPREFVFPIKDAKTLAEAFDLFRAAAQAFVEEIGRAQKEEFERNQENANLAKIVTAKPAGPSIDEIQRSLADATLPPHKRMFGRKK